MAAIHGDLAAINRALADGADPNAADDDGGCFPLIFAVSGNHTECAARLIEAGANPNCRMNQHLGITPLNLAASYTNRGADVVRVLLAGGAQVDFKAPNSSGTPLHYAFDGGNLEAIRVLLAAGADPNHQRNLRHRRLPLASAVWYISGTDDEGITGLIARRCCRVPPLLLCAGASINEPAITALFQNLNDPYIDPCKRKVIEYLQAVYDAGGFPAYARRHRSMYAAIFSRGTRLPADVVPNIVEYWAHLGCYQYQVPGLSARARRAARRERHKTNV